jgi:hypothetical protein
VTLHGLLHVPLPGAWLQVEYFVQSIELEEVAMGFARRRAGAARRDISPGSWLLELSALPVFDAGVGLPSV